MEAQPQETALELAVRREAGLIATPGHYPDELQDALTYHGYGEVRLRLQFSGQSHTLSIRLPPDYPRTAPRGFFVGPAPAHPFYAFDTDDEQRRWRHTNLANTDRGLCYQRWDCRNTLRDYVELLLYSLTEEGERALVFMSRAEREPLLLPGLECVHERPHYYYNLARVTDWPLLAEQLCQGAALTHCIWFCDEAADALRLDLERLARLMQVRCEWTVGVKPRMGTLSDGRPYGALLPRRLSLEQQEAARLKRWQGYACLFEGAPFERLPVPLQMKMLTGVGYPPTPSTLEFVFWKDSVRCLISPWVRCTVFDGTQWHTNLSYAQAIEQLCSLF
jgi:hypothetical protein